MRITGITPQQPSVVSNPDGTATVKVKVTGVGSGACEIRVMGGDGIESVTVTPENGLPKKIPVHFSKPSTYGLTAYGVGCSGTATAQVTIQPHLEYPCSLYPGFKKDTFGIMTFCRPNMPGVNNVKPEDFSCQPGTKFQFVGGYIFGCFAPGFLLGQ